MDDDVIRGWIAEERRRTARDLRIISDSAWDLPSLCSAWRCRDVLGHLVWLAEASRPRVILDVAKTLRPPTAAIGHIARKLGDSDPGSLLDRLDAAAEGGFTPPGTGPQTALAEVLAHRADITRVTEGPTRSSDERTAVAIEAYLELWWYFGVPSRVRKARLVADDAGFEVGPSDGPEVRGAGTSLLLALAGRPSARAELRGAVDVFG